MGRVKPVIPKWLGITQKELSKLDLGAEINPLTKYEVEAGIVIRGPVIMMPTPSTPKQFAKLLPLACHDVRFAEEGKYMYMEYYLGTNERRIERISKVAVNDVSNRLLIETATRGMIKFRAFKMGDKALYMMGPNQDAKDISSFIKSIWKIGLI